MKGWECPRCGKIHNPISMTCGCPLPSGVTSAGTTMILKSFDRYFAKVTESEMEKDWKKY